MTRRCNECGYSLEGLGFDARCPECGSTLDVRQTGRSWFFAAMVAIGAYIVALFLLHQTLGQFSLSVLGAGLISSSAGIAYLTTRALAVLLVILVLFAASSIVFAILFFPFSGSGVGAFIPGLVLGPIVMGWLIGLGSRAAVSVFDLH